jgi:ribosome modulation factor
VGFVKPAPSAFERRRAVERLRDGLFDPLAVRLLTAHEERLRRAADRGLKAAAAGKGAHLCVTGPYGHGKSHSLAWIHGRALEQGYAASLVNLDPREVPFHDLSQVYRAVFANLQLPDSPGSFAARWRAWASDEAKGAELAETLPEQMPHLFRATLVAMAQRTLPKSERKTSIPLGPRTFPALLERALAGEPVPLQTYRAVLRLRQVPFVDAGSLRNIGSEPYLLMLRSLAELLRTMGYRGLVTLFDEGESILAGRVTQRSRSYELLDRFFRPERQAPGLFAVFAFTEDFFRQLEAEDFDRVQVRAESETPFFARDYAAAWRKLEVYRLDELSRKDWQELAGKLLRLHTQAYGWKPDEARTLGNLMQRVDEMAGEETRLRLKALVDALDVLQQERLFGTA